MIGMSMTMEVDQAGKVVSFTGMDAINKKVSAEAVASMHWAQMQEEFTNERGRETWGEEPLRIYPNKEVKVGDTWKATSSVARPRIGEIVTDYEYKVEKIGMENGRKTVLIAVTGVVSKGAEPAVEAAAAGASSEEEGEEAEDEAKPKEAETTVKGALSGKRYLRCRARPSGHEDHGGPS